MDALVSIECRSARGIRAGEKERERERESERDVSSSFFLLLLLLLCCASPARSSCGYRLAARVVDSFGAVKSPESVRLCDRGRGGVRGFPPIPPRRWCSAEPTETGGILVDPASSHMLVSKIKPCMSKFTPSYGETANGSLNQSRFLR